MKALIHLLIPALLLTSCSDQRLRQDVDRLIAENQALKAELRKQQKAASQPDVTLVQLVKLSSRLPDSAVVETMRQRRPQFLEVPGLVQKYYLHDTATGTFGGLYLWQSEQHYRDFRQSQLAKSIADAYQPKGKPRMEVYKLLFPLRKH